jgi:hypothetical protein
MPNFRVYLLNDPVATEGTLQTWDLPWERLVFDQRLDYEPQGPEGQPQGPEGQPQGPEGQPQGTKGQPKGTKGPGRFRIVRIRQTADGTVYDVAPDPGCLHGGDPKRARP